MERCDRNRIMEMNIRDQINNYYYLLKHYSEYENKEEMLKFFFKKKNDKNLSELYITYKLERFAKAENEKQLFAKVLAWTYENLNYKQNKEFVQEETAINILQFSKQNKSGVNCRNHAIVLTEVLLALGYSARTICCMPIDLTSYDNHTMTAVYSKKANKWLALDAANCCWYCDDQFEILSFDEIRKNLIERKKIEINFTSRFYDRLNIKQKEKKQLLQYLWKNMFRFYCSAGILMNGMEVYYHLVPYSFLPSDIQYAHDIYGRKTMIITTTNEKQFWKAPE